MAKQSYQDISTLSIKELKSYIANEGKKANTRLVALEKSNKDLYSNAYSKLFTKYSIDKDKNLSISNSGHLKFNLNVTKRIKGLSPSQQRNSLLNLATDIEKFLKSKTSTTKGVNAKYNKITKALETKYNTSIDLDILGEMFGAYNENKLQVQYGSDQIVEVYEKYIDELPTNELVDIIKTTTGISQSDLEADIKLSILKKEYAQDIDEKTIEEIVNNNRSMTINRLRDLLSEKLVNQDWNDVN